MHWNMLFRGHETHRTLKIYSSFARGRETANTNDAVVYIMYNEYNVMEDRTRKRARQLLRTRCWKLCARHPTDRVLPRFIPSADHALFRPSPPAAGEMRRSRAATPRTRISITLWRHPTRLPCAFSESSRSLVRKSKESWNYCIFPSHTSRTCCVAADRRRRTATTQNSNQGHSELKKKIRFVYYPLYYIMLHQ